MSEFDITPDDIHGLFFNRPRVVQVHPGKVDEILEIFGRDKYDVSYLQDEDGVTAILELKDEFR
jgi:hypothetical protein